MRCFAGLAPVVLAFVVSPALAHDNMLIVPGVSVGPITSASSEADFAGTLPEGQVKRVLYSIGEGMAGCGTEVFAGTDDAVVIAWSNAGGEFELDNEADLATCRARTEMGHPVEVWISDKAVRWRTAEGVGLGMSVSALAKIVGAPLEVSVCPCDFGGYIELPEVFREKLSIWADYPQGADYTYRDVIDETMDYMLSTGDIAARDEGGFVLWRMIVGLGE